MRGFTMRKIIFLIPLIFLSTFFEDSNAMHRRSMKRMHMQKGHQRRRGKAFRPRRQKRVVRCNGRNRRHVEKKAELVESLFAPVTPEKTFSLRPFVPSIDFSFANKGLISKILFFYVIFGQILSNQQTNCIDFVFRRNYNDLGRLNNYLDAARANSNAIFDSIQSSVDASFERSRQEQEKKQAQQEANRRREEAERAERLRQENERRRREKEEADRLFQEQQEERIRAEAEAVAQRAREEEAERQQAAAVQGAADPQPDAFSKADASMAPLVMQAGQAHAEEQLRIIKIS